MVFAAPLSNLKSSSNHCMTSSSVNSNFSSTSALNLPTDSDKSKDRGSISPDQDGTVGFLPKPSFTTTVERFDSMN